MSKALESSVEKYLVEQVEKLGGIALKGAVPGRRFLDRILIMPGGVTVYVECKRPKGSKVSPRVSAHQAETLERLQKLGHHAWKTYTKGEVDVMLAACALPVDTRALALEEAAVIADKAAVDAAYRKDAKDAKTASGTAALVGYIFAETEAKSIASLIRALAK